MKDQMKDQAMALIPDEMQDKSEKKQNGEKSNVESSEKGKQISQKKPKKKIL